MSLKKPSRLVITSTLLFSEMATVRLKIERRAHLIAHFLTALLLPCLWLLFRWACCVREEFELPERPLKLFQVIVSHLIVRIIIYYCDTV